MILDRFENVEEYFDRIPNLEKACAFIRRMRINRINAFRKRGLPPTGNM